MMPFKQKASIFFGILSCVFYADALSQNAPLHLIRENGIKVFKSQNDPMELPWTGGLNFCQAGELDIDLDGIHDLVFFDRCGDRIIPLRYQGPNGSVRYQFNPDFIKNFPDDIHEFMLLRDYNCDGKADIFTYNNSGIKIYKNVSSSTSGLAFQVFTDQVSSDFKPVKLPVFTLPIDVPSIEDVDGDGDIDLLVFGFGGRCIEYHRNMAKEKLNRCDTIMLELFTDNWGNFTEDFSTNSISLNDSCDNPKSRAGELRHAGSSLLAIDMDGDQDKDLIIGDVSYSSLIKLNNGGNKIKAMISSQELNFPSGTKSVNLSLFPSAYSADIDHDGKNDLLVCPNSESNSENYRCIWYYKNIGTKEKPNFSFASDTFLISETMDFGQGAIPLFFDHNLDGKMDIVVGNDGYYKASGIKSQLALVENIGTETSPEFLLKDLNYSGLSTLSVNARYFHPAFCDADGDGDQDMLVGGSDGQLIFFENIAPIGSAATFSSGTPFFQQIDVGTYAAPFPYDVNRDGKMDLIIGTGEGKIKYYENISDELGMKLKLVSDSWGNVNTSNADFPQGRARPVIFEKSGESFLLCGSSSGSFFVYSGLEDNDFVLRDTLFLGRKNGENTSVGLFDLDNDGLLDAITGNESGGLAFFRGEEPNTTKSSLIKDSNEILIQPNPGKDYLIIKIPAGMEWMNHSLLVTDLNGRIMLDRKINGKEISIQAGDWCAGVYMVRISNQKGEHYFKWIRF